MRKVQIKLKHLNYPIYIGSGIISEMGKLLNSTNKNEKIVIVTDKIVARKYLNSLKNNLNKYGFNNILTIEIGIGEKEKSLSRADSIYTDLIKNKVSRNSVIMSLGGGVVGDLSGFVASTYLRGVKFAQIPTTLLAQVDSAIGGKVGVNHNLGKNLIGSFYHPQFVLCDTEFLKSLPKREIICGLAEIIKYGIIKDKKIFNFIEINLNDILAQKINLDEIIYSSVKIKSQVVEKDERENNLRAILNCGHTIGHALEKCGNYKYWKHGEAILLGLAGEAFIAKELKMLAENEFKVITSLIKKIPIPKISKLKIKNNSLLEVMSRDKKVKDSKIRFALPLAVGKVSMPFGVEVEQIIKSLNYLKNNF